MFQYLAQIKTQVLQVCSRAGDFLSLKIPLAFIAGAGDYLFGPNGHPVNAILITLVIFDFVTAIMVSFKKGEPIESKKAFKTVTKIVVYGIFLSASHLTEQVIPGTTFLDETAGSFLAITELISIIENIGHLGYAIPKKLLNRLEELRQAEAQPNG